MTLFEGTLKTITNRPKCDGIFLEKIILSFLGDFFFKKRKFVTKYSVFKKLCQLLMIFHPKKN
jgi:hypothetical protein